MWFKRFAFIMFIFCLQVSYGCLPTGTPFGQVDIPKLDSSRSRVFFYYSKAAPELVRIASDDNGLLKSLVVLNHQNECSYVDLDPGDYKIRVVGSTAGGEFWRTKEHAIYVSFDSGKTYYVQVAWYSVPPKLFDNVFKIRKGINLILMDAEEGQADVSKCLYVDREEALKWMGKLNGD
jgi:hypothetical protein